MKKRFFRKLLVASGIMFLAGNVSMATEGFYEKDVTAPWGRISIVGATEVNNVNYVDRQKVTVQIYAADDKCADTEIKYYISTSEILDSQKVETWYDYTPGLTKEIELPSTTSTNKIYAVFKDKNGNTSLIYSGVGQTVEYNVNGTNATMATGMATTRTYGAPFVVTSQTPTREGYFFKGWGLNAGDTEASYYAEDIIYPDDSVGTEDKLTFYAIWTTETEGLQKLADVVKVGDYVNYPVYYDNALSCSYKGWRVLSKDVDIDGNVAEGTVNLVSAGVPLTYYHTSPSSTGVSNLTLNFLDIAFVSSGVGFRKTGFNPYQSLTSIFTNKYTATYASNTTVEYPTYDSTVSATKTAGTLKVRAMTKEDLDKIYDPTGATVTASGTSVTNAKFQNLLNIGTNHWLASASSSNLWSVRTSGSVDSNYSYAYGVRPVVSLKSDIKATGRDSIGAWNIEI